MKVRRVTTALVLAVAGLAVPMAVTPSAQATGCTYSWTVTQVADATHPRVSANLKLTCKASSAHIEYSPASSSSVGSSITGLQPGVVYALKSGSISCGQQVYVDGVVNDASGQHVTRILGARVPFTRGC